MSSAGKTGTCPGTARRSRNPPRRSDDRGRNPRPLGRRGSQFKYGQGCVGATNAVEWAQAHRFKPGSITYFAVDYDARDRRRGLDRRRRLSHVRRRHHHRGVQPCHGRRLPVHQPRQDAQDPPSSASPGRR
ncbi:glycoside hydrolase domain-containing protein [Streptomyces litmocidini]|uniref:Glycoside hydrolase domain-containing protein n=1 Tax=Streptomyces litmocidini TaxID=67318 RepID=A0ABW7U6T3_9ACTN